MKTPTLLNYWLLAALSLSIFWLVGCSKSSPAPGKNTSKNELKVTASKVNTAPHDPPINDMITCYHDGKIYVLDADYTNAFDPAAKVFMSYDIAGNKWKVLQGPAYSDYPTSKLIYHDQLDAIIALGFDHKKYTYATEDYFIPSNRNKWFVQDIPHEFQLDAGVYSYGNGKIYNMGNNMLPDGRLTLTEYGTNWENLLTINEYFTGAMYRNSVFQGKNMYVLADVESSVSENPQGFIFNTDALTVEKFDVPKSLNFVVIGISYNQMAVYKDVLLILHAAFKMGTGADKDHYQLSAYNTKTKTWYDKDVDLPTDFLDRADAELYVTETGKIYAVGIKNNNFALYELKVSLPEGW